MEQQIRVHFGQSCKCRIVSRGKTAKRAVHEVGDGSGLEHWELGTEDCGCIVPSPHPLTQSGQVEWLTGVNWRERERRCRESEGKKERGFGTLKLRHYSLRLICIQTELGENVAVCLTESIVQVHKGSTNLGLQMH